MQLPKLLAKLQPLLVDPPSSQDVMLQLLAKESDEYYEHQGRLLHGLGKLSNQYRIITLSTDIRDTDVINKLKQLVLKESGKVLQAEAHLGWNLTIEGQEGSQNIGHIPLIFTHDRGTHNMPEFMSKVAKYLKTILSGSFYCGYWKDPDTSIMCPFAFAFVYVPEGQEATLKTLGKIAWNQIDKKSNISTGSVTASNQLLTYRRKSTWLTPVILIALILVGVSVINRFFHFNDLLIPWDVLYPATMISLALGYLDYLNRKGSISLKENELVVSGGVIPLFPGYSRRRFQRNEIIRVWIKTVSSSEGPIDGPVMNYTGYSVFVTTSKPSEKRLSAEMGQHEAELIKSRIEKWMQGR